ncbi:hypothetical protein Ddc_12566 [Ditylenchus destructor]|nr:hypothetical protein Ddc_12566 [Ditylenchus destructor]
MTEGNKYNHLLTSVLNDIALTSHISICVKFDNATMLSLLGGRTIMEMPAIQQCRCVSITCDRHDALLSFGTAEQIIDWLYSEQQSRPRLDFIDAHSPTYFDLDIYGICGENRNSAGHQTNAITKETLQISKSSSHIKIKRRPSSMFWAYNSSAGNKLVVRHEQN